MPAKTGKDAAGESITSAAPNEDSLIRSFNIKKYIYSLIDNISNFNYLLPCEQSDVCKGVYCCGICRRQSTV